MWYVNLYRAGEIGVALRLMLLIGAIMMLGSCGSFSDSAKSSLALQQLKNAPESMLFFMARNHSANKLITWDVDSSILNIFLQQAVMEGIFTIKSEGVAADSHMLGTKYEWPEAPLQVWIIGHDAVRPGELLSWHRMAEEKNECNPEWNPATVLIEVNTSGLVANSAENPLPVLCAIAREGGQLKSIFDNYQFISTEAEINGAVQSGKGWDCNGDSIIDLFWYWREISEIKKEVGLYKRDSTNWNAIWTGYYEECI